MKKVLSFVLVLAMILGSVSMAFAFTDDAAITNKEAAAVLNAAGIIEGYTDGSFKASGILTRAEGAAIAARMLLGKKDAAKLSTVVSPFNDVPASHWAAGYIAYCVAQGLLNGYGNGNFGPDDTLTVAAFGKMMLTALGYKSDLEGFVGDGWETRVGSVMVKAKLTDGVTMTNDAACSREVAAQVALNTLKADIVDYAQNGVSVSTGNATVTVGASKAERQLIGAAGVDAKYDGNIANDGYAQFAEKYQNKLKLEATTEKFGRPDSKKWTYDGVKAYEKKTTDDLVATYTTKQTQKTIYALLDNLDAKGYTVTVNVNTAKATVVNATYAGIADAGNVSYAAVKNNTGTFANDVVGAGTQMEVYANSSAKTVKFVIYDYYVAKATADYNANKESLNVEMQSANPNGKAIGKIDKSDVSAVTTVKEDEYIAFTYADNAVQSITPVTPVTGAVSGYTKGTDVTVGGTKYSVSGNFDGGSANAFDGLAANSDVTLILDPNNYVVKTADEVSKKQYIYIAKAAQEGALETEKKAIAYFLDGTKQTITLDDAASYDLVSGGGIAGWFNYSVKSNGNYKLRAIDAGKVKNAVLASAGISSGAVNYVPAEKAVNDTVFLVHKDGKSSATVYTGYKTVPGTNSVATYSAVYGNATDGYSKYVFIETPSNASLIGASTSDYLIIYKSDFKTSMADDKNYLYNAKSVLNGTAGQVEFDESYNKTAVGLYNNVSYNSEGRVDAADQINGEVFGEGFATYTTRTTTAAVTPFAYSDGVITITTGAVHGVADNAVAYVYDGDTLDQVTFKNIKGNLDEDVEYKVFVKFTDTSMTKHTVEAIYFVHP